MRFRIGPVSGSLRWRPVVLVLVGFAVLVLLVALSVARGDFPIRLGQVFDVLLGGGQRGQRFVVLELRLPRALTGALVGAALGVAGAVFQSIARNALASPDVLGVTWGAGAGAVGVITLTGSFGAVSGSASKVGVPVAALVGGLVAGVLVYGLAWRRGIDGFRLVLVGVGVSAVAGSFTQYLLTVGDVTDAARAMVWITGSLNGRGWEHVVPVGLALVVLLPAALVGTRLLGVLQLDEDTVRGLGVRVSGARTALLLIAVVLASVATAAAGPVAFVALASPQVAVRLAGASAPPVAGSAVVGGVLVVGSDLLARTLFGGVELPVGVVTAVLGAPYLMFLLVRGRREARV
ncbi:iron chelate uptake ABC transporter family permease subunit [Actinosynnema sp. NPDC020468]|uniref:FecCD family ABC transporter permease n=1 Tax=Actinosynnema sp. NPDC020468 TaxID=3154488 RepID=UPI0033DB4E86